MNHERFLVAHPIRVLPIVAQSWPCSHSIVLRLKITFRANVRIFCTRGRITISLPAYPRSGIMWKSPDNRRRGCFARSSPVKACTRRGSTRREVPPDDAILRGRAAHGFVVQPELGGDRYDLPMLSVEEGAHAGTLLVRDHSPSQSCMGVVDERQLVASAAN